MKAIKRCGFFVHLKKSIKMEEVVKKTFKNFEFGELQHYENMSVFPILVSMNSGPEYLTMKEAIEGKLLIIKEVSDQGQVPVLAVLNDADLPVLLLDSEEVVGAKQNRILNTSILLDKKSETIIPVSCTERGRWSYRTESKMFSDADVVAPSDIRIYKLESVSQNLRSFKKFDSNQSKVWDSIEELSFKAKASSSTGAMHDVFRKREKDLKEYLKAFKILPRQKGLFVFINGEFVGFDMVSLESAYKSYHQKLLKSYAMTARLIENKQAEKPSVEKTREVLDQIVKSFESRYESVGLGHDYRYEGKHHIGSAWYIAIR